MIEPAPSLFDQAQEQCAEIAHCSAPAQLIPGAIDPDMLGLRAVIAFLAERARDAQQFGHTPESDRALPLKCLPDRALRYIVHAQEDMHFRRDGWQQRAQRHLAQAGALLSAAWDRLAAECEDQEPRP